MKPQPSAQLARPSECIPAEEAALVRPYYLLHEADQRHEAERARAEAATRPPLSRPCRPHGDLLDRPLVPAPGEFDELAALIRLWQRQRRRATVA
ncbi:hypothetical protein [Nocardiopsis sp. CNT312]|uniref:hypothetical protein n=1 Tax=Nocardiopsis sp. CNT312 TaxID=1137268 RepID=UPI0012DEE64B|nr:hypothetical protein [Nocardiopsis sp. CNT312]